MNKVRVHKDNAWSACGDDCPVQTASVSGERAVCGAVEDGFVGVYPCNSIDLLAFVSLADLGSAPGADGSDIWGWTDPLTNREYVLMTQMDGTSYVDISDPMNPLVLVFIPAQVPDFRRQFWRDVKVFDNHAFIVGDRGDHGMQVFDLTRLRGLHENYEGITQMEPDAFYDEFGPCHNIVINEETGYAYCVGSTTCRGGLHMVDIARPKDPQFAGCASNDGYIHDAECIVYDGPDDRYTGQEICFGYNEDSLTIYDVTDKAYPCVVSRTEYDNSAYTHQGWLTDDRRFMLMNDELDEFEGDNKDNNTLTFIWDVQSLTDPVQFARYYSPVVSIDHNIYIEGQFAYMSNYGSGLRVNDISRIADGVLEEVAFFDVHPENDTAEFFGTWSNYPYFESGVVAVSSIERGLFLLKPTSPGMKDLSPAIDREIFPTEPPRLPWWWWWWWW